jgi:hypothetical protein
MKSDGEPHPKRHTLVRAYGLSALTAIFLAAVPEILNFTRGADIHVGLWPYLLMLVMGALCTRVTSIGYGMLGGAIAALVFSISGGLVFIMTTSVPAGDAARAVVSSVIITTVFGVCVGGLGGLPVMIWKAWLKGRQHPLSGAGGMHTSSS